MFINALLDEATLALARIATGRLFTKEQIRHITRHSLGRYLEDLFPKDAEDLPRAERLSAARNHIENASVIIAEMRIELNAQAEALDRLVEEINEKKSLADRYASLASANKDAVSAMTMEIEEAIGNELARRSEEGRTARRVASATLALVTLVSGAALGAYFKDIIDWLLHM